MEYEGLEIRPGGLLVSSYWDKESKSFKEEDVTNQSIRLVFENCQLHAETTLQDVFLLLNSQIEMFVLFFGSLVEEMTNEALIPASNKTDDIKFLELYWHLSYDVDPFTNKEVLAGTRFPSFHGVGENDFYSVALSKINNLTHLKLKLRDEAIIHDFRKEVNTEIAKFANMEYTFGQIIHGIIWELTFYGSPTMRDEMSKTLQKRIDDIESGKTELIPWEEVKKNIKENLQKP
jgi:hypothetical protein